MRRVPLVVAVLALVGCGGGPSSEEKDAAVAAAYAIYAQATTAGVVMENGPCLADPLAAMPEWVVDVAHDPRQEVDDDPANQCSSYRSGQADHFVELDPAGNLIRAR
jgi:hypothetical protein